MKHLVYVFIACVFFASCTSQISTQSDSSLAAGSHPMIANSETAITTTESGEVAGYLHQDVFNFKGIPYAQAERFMPPQQPDSWEGVRSSRAYGPVCPINVESMILSDELEFAQQHNFAYMNEEKCMNLNVWTKGLNDGTKRPVMVWLHGGGYTAGSSCELPSYDGENLSRTGDVVVVSINHRLNVLGFLDLSAVSDKYAQSANVGMMDIVAALQWVNKNIENFGGDPSNVTIFGQSGGGGKVNTLMYTPSAKGLFQKAIMQSGGGGGFTSKELTQKVGPAILLELGIKPSEIEKINDVPYAELLAAGNRALAKVSQGTEGLFGGVSWSPSQDGEFIPYQPGDAGAEDIAKDIPVMMGSNKVEFGSFSAPEGMLHADENTVTEYLSSVYGENTEAFIEAFKKAYPNTNLPSDMTDFDLMFRPNLLQFADLKSSVSEGAPVYNYLFCWNSPVLDGMIKSGHCMEINFVFNNIARNEQYTGGTPEAYVLAEKLSKTWVTFASTGNPNNPEIPEWEPYSRENGATMLLDNQSELRFHHDTELLKIASGQN